MLNIEKYFDKIIDIVKADEDVALTYGEPLPCSDLTNCTYCDFYAKDEVCREFFLEWCVKEYEEIKIKIPFNAPIDTKVLVSTDGVNWEKRHYAGHENGKCYAWKIGYTSWTAKDFLDDDIKQSWPYMKLALDEN